MIRIAAIAIALLAGCTDEPTFDAPDAVPENGDAPPNTTVPPRFGGGCTQTSLQTTCENDAGWCVVAEVNAAPTCRARCTRGARAGGDSTILSGQLYSCALGETIIPIAGPSDACYCLPETAVQP